MPGFGKAERETSYTNVAGSEEDLEKPLQDDSSISHDVPDGDLYELKRQLRRTNLFLRLILGFIGAAAATVIIFLLARIAREARTASGPVYKPLIKTPVPPRKPLTFPARDQGLY